MSEPNFVPPTNPTYSIPVQRQQSPQTPPPAPKRPRVWWKVTLGVAAGFILGLAVGAGQGASAGATDTAATATAAPAPADTTPVASAPAPVTPVPAAPAYTPPAPAPTPVQAGPLTSFDDGVYEVGVDIEAGKYKTPGPATTDILDSCYMEVGDGSGSLQGIDQNDNLTGPGVVTLKAGKVFKVSGGCTWTKVS
jgi:hypothetical protein